MTATQKGGILLAISAIAAPIAGYLFHRSAESWRSFGQGPFSIGSGEMPPPRRAGAPPPPVDPAIDAELRAEVRQLVVARNERRRREGLEPLDVEAETERQLADLIGSG